MHSVRLDLHVSAHAPQGGGVPVDAAVGGTTGAARTEDAVATVDVLNLRREATTPLQV